MSAAVADDRERLWTLYKKGKDLRAREELILNYASLVKYIAGRLAMGMPPNVELDDLISYGIFGLIDAIEKFDPERGVKFETYAIARIKGAILDGLRAFDWAPHSLRQKARELERAYGDLEAKLGRSVSDEEVAGHLGISLEQLQGRLAGVSSLALLSLDDLWPNEGFGDGLVRPLDTIIDDNSPDPVAFVVFEEKKALLAEAIDKLPEKERLVVALYYYEGLTAKEISQVMNLSQSRISQLHSKAILRLRGRLSRLKNRLVS
ncbi:MAG: FliA/WhiG family RNA polymerase sigma factor [Bacillota bacterium]